MFINIINAETASADICNSHLYCCVRPLYWWNIASGWLDKVRSVNIKGSDLIPLTPLENTAHWNNHYTYTCGCHFRVTRLVWVHFIACVVRLDQQ